MATPQMPDPPVPLTKYDPRHSPDASREECMIDIDFGCDTTLDEKIYVAPDVIPGGRGDETGIAAEIIRNEERGER